MELPGYAGLAQWMRRRQIVYPLPECPVVGYSAGGGSHMARVLSAELPYPVCQEILWIGFGYLGDWVTGTQCIILETAYVEPHDCCWLGRRNVS